MRALYFICFVGITMLGSSCSYKQNQILFEKKAPIADTLSQATATISYHIQPQDILQIRNLQNLKYIVDEAPTFNSSGSSGNSAASQGQTFQVVPMLLRKASKLPNEKMQIVFLCRIYQPESYLQNYRA
jgi:polysaccharide export outer membrane protein